MKATLPAVVSAAVLAGFRAVLTSPDAADVRDGLRALIREEVQAALVSERRKAQFVHEQAEALRRMAEPEEGKA